MGDYGKHQIMKLNVSGFHFIWNWIGMEADNIFPHRHFEVGDRSPKDAAKLFSVPDFVGDACKAIASRIRGAVAGVQFDDFHKVINKQIKQPPRKI